MKLQVCKRGPVAVVINGVVKKFQPGDTFEMPNEKDAERILGITPPIVKRPGIASAIAAAVKGKGKGRGKGKGAKQEEVASESESEAEGSGDE